MKDTSDKMEAKFRELMMSRSPAERLEMACNMFTTAQNLMRAGIRDKYGDLPEREVRKHMFVRLYAQDFSEEEMERILEKLT